VFQETFDEIQNEFDSDGRDASEDEIEMFIREATMINGSYDYPATRYPSQGEGD